MLAADPMQLVTWVPPPDAPQTGVRALLGNLLGPPFSPTVEGPGGVLPDLPAKLIASGKFNEDAAILAGTNKNEWGLFVDLATSPVLGGSSASQLNVTTAAQLNQGIDESVRSRCADRACRRTHGWDGCSYTDATAEPRRHGGDAKQGDERSRSGQSADVGVTARKR